ncbi:MAG: hypothetical protein ACK2T3_11075 [Candidatus Promineifilaceae bacterium]
MRARKGCRIVMFAAIGLIGLCLLAAGVSALSNLTFPARPEEMDRLSVLDKARFAEAMNLKAKLGESIWPGWESMDMPFVIWNRDYSFLVGLDEPGRGWEIAADDTFQGKPYYREQSIDPQNFAVLVNDQWAASMATKNETDQKMREIWQDVLPPIIEQVFPYRLLLQPSEVQISAVLHESFHVYQMEVAQDRLEDAEKAYSYEDRYWLADEDMDSEWSREIELLAQALTAEDDAESVQFSREFLEARDDRRESHQLDSELIMLEQRYEWLEGLAKYVELESWRQAWVNDEYEIVEEMEEDPDFKGYGSFEQRWSQEIGQMKRQAGTEGVTRFYYTGMAQAMLLDRLYPGWKEKIMGDGIWLEDLLREALAQPTTPAG